MIKTTKAAEIAGLRAMLVHAKDEAAMKFYGRYGFDASTTNPHNMVLPLKDLRRIVARLGPGV